jgi:hypothetical protein
MNMPTLMNRNPARRLATAAVATLATLGLTGSAHADLQDQVPAEALMVMKFNDLAGTSEKIAKLATDFGIAAFQPEFGDPLGSLKQQSGVTNGIDDSGDAALVLLAPPEGEDDPLNVFLAPISDYAAFLANFEGNEEVPEIDIDLDDDLDEDDVEAAVEMVTPEGVDSVVTADGTRIYIIQRGDYAAISEDADTVANMAEGGLTVEGLSGEQFADQDMVIYANTKALEKALAPLMEEGMPEAIDEITSELPEDYEQFEPVVAALVKQGYAAAGAFFRDADAATIGLSFGDDGISYTIVADFAEDSYLGQSIGSLQGTDSSLLTGLPEIPAQPYLVYGGADLDGEALVGIVNDVIEPAMTELDKIEGEKAQFIQEFVTRNIEATKGIDGGTFGILAPAGDFGQTPAVQFISVTYGDTQPLFDAQIKNAEQQQDVYALFMPGQADDMPVQEYKKGAKEVAGVTFDSITTPDTTGGPGAMIYGPEGMKQFIAVDDGKLLTFSGVDDAVVEQFITASRENSDPLAALAGVEEVAEMLPVDRVAVYYIALDEIMTTAGDVAQQFGAPVQLNLPPGLPPVGATISTQDGALVIQTYIPARTVQALVAQGMQTYMQMQGGAAPGGRGGL